MWNTAFKRCLTVAHHISRTSHAKFATKPVRIQAPVSSFSVENIGQWMNIPLEDFSLLNFDVYMPERVIRNADTLQESCLMVRRQYLDIINCIQKTALLDKPVIRYVVYGKLGTGKSVTLGQVAYWAYTQGWVVVHVHDAGIWYKSRAEAMKSSYNPSRYDMPVVSAKWLVAFKRANAKLLEGCVTTKSYQWNEERTTEAGEPLLNVVEQGISQPKTSSDCMSVLFNELKHYARQKQIKLLVVVDHVNAVFAGLADIWKDKPRGPYVEMEKLTMMRALKKILHFDWNNGAIVTSVDAKDIMEETKKAPRNSHLPNYLLGKHGFDYMDPFVPIETMNYTDEEAQSLLNYYIDRHWITTVQGRSEEGQRQIKLMTERNPLQMEKMCAWL